MSQNAKRGKVYKPGYDNAAGGIQVGNVFLKRQDMADWTRAVNEARSKFFPRRRLLHELYQNIILDGHLQSVMTKRTAGVTNKQLRWFVDGEPEQDGTDDIYKSIIKTPWFLRFLEGAMSAIPYGTTVLELNVKGGEVVDVSVIPRANVSPERGLVLADVYDTDSGIDYRNDKFWSKYLIQVGDVDNYGGLMVAAMYVLYKRGGLANWAQFMELFGMPLRKGTYNPYDEASRTKLKEALENMGSASYIVLPEGANVEFITASQGSQGASSIYDNNIERCNAEISKLFLGQTLTTEQGKVGTQALGTVHADTQDDITTADMHRIEYLLNYELKPRLIALGYPLAKGEFAFYTDDALPPSERIKVDVLVAGQIDVGESYWRKTYNIPPPTTEEIKAITDRKAEKAAAAQAATQAMTGRQGNTPKEEKAEEEGEKSDDEEPTAPLAPGEGKGVRAIKAQLTALYKPSLTAATPSSFDDLARDPIWHAIVTGIHDGRIKPGAIDPDLMKWTADQLTQAVMGGGMAQGGEQADGESTELQGWMRNNVAVFSGFKTYHTLRAATDELLDEDGNVRPFNEFRDRVLAIDQEYNVNYLRAEYEQAVSSAQMAEQWQSYQATKEALPFLRYDTAGDDRVRPVHAGWDGITLPIEHPFWNTHYPPNGWRCRCDVSQQESDAGGRPVNVDELAPAVGMFANNVGKNGIVFPQGHPYFNAPKEVAAKVAKAVEKITPKPPAPKPSAGPDTSKPKVSAALKASKKSLEKIMKETMGAIDSSHGDGALDALPLDTGITKRGVWGEFISTRYTNRAVKIKLRPLGADPHMTLAHEVGHWLDLTALGKGQGFATLTLEKMKPVLNAIRESAAYKAQKATVLRGTIIDANGLERPLHLSMREHITDYLWMREEQWARAYAQYIALRSENTVMVKELEAMLKSSNTTLLNEQWNPDDFAPIAGTIDELFKAEGWRH